MSYRSSFTVSRQMSHFPMSIFERGITRPGECDIPASFKPTFLPQKPLECDRIAMDSVYIYFRAEGCKETPPWLGLSCLNCLSILKTEWIRYFLPNPPELNHILLQRTPHGRPWQLMWSTLPCLLFCTLDATPQSMMEKINARLSNRLFLIPKIRGLHAKAGSCYQQ